VDPRDLPRVDMNDLLSRGLQPIAVSQAPGQEYIVMAPEGGFVEAEQTPPAPKTYLSPEEHHQMLEERAGQQLAQPLRSQVSGLARRGRPSAVPDGSGLGFNPPPEADMGFGQSTGETRVHSRVDMAKGQGVGLGSPVPELGAELGSAVPSPFTSWMRREYNRDLLGTKGLRVYDRMRKSDGTVRGTLRLAKTPVLAGQWSMKPASTSARDIMIARKVWKNLTKWMTTSWPQTLTESLLMLDFGYYMFEEVFAPGEQVTNDPDARGMIIWKKWAPRHPMDVREWFFDRNGGPLSVDLWTSPEGVPTWEGGNFGGYLTYTNIPINKMLVFSFDKEAGNIEGISLLRSAYKHWYYKDNLYKIDAIQKERHGIGVPVIQLPQGYSQDDLQLADALGRNLRTNDRAHVVLPPNWVLAFAELRGQPVDCIRSIEHHDTQIEKQIIGGFLSKPVKTDEQDQTLFLKATRFTADIVTDVVNKFGIPQLVDMNWIGADYPELVVKRIGEQEDWRTESFTIRNYVGAGVITPDQTLEDHLREELGLPASDPATSRLVHQTFNKNIAQPPPDELPGTPEDMIQALKDGSVTVEQLQQMQNQAPAQQQGPDKPGLPRQTSNPTVKPSTGRGDSSGTSGRRGQ
jgi:hypothetical protein